MNKKAVRIIAVIMAIAMVAGVIAMGVTYVFAEDAQSQITESEKKVNEQKEKIKDIEEKKELTASDIEELKKETVGIQDQIDTKESEIAETAKELDEAEADLEDAKEKSSNQYDAYKERFRVMCEDGSVSYLQVILTSDSIMDFVNNIETAQEISEYDKQIYDEMKDSEAEIQRLTDEIASNKARQESEKEVLAQQKSALDTKQGELEAVKLTLQSDAEAAQKIIDEEIAKQNELKTQIASQLSKEGDGSVYSGASGNAQANTASGNGGSEPATQVSVGSGGFVWPTPSCRYITSSYAPQRVNPVTGKLRPHTGTDIGAQYGANVVATAGGTVRFSGWNGGYGNCVIIDHGGGKASLYAHMSSRAVSAGQQVSAGQSVGKVGSTGNSTGPHLHFEILINGSAVDPMQYF